MKILTLVWSIGIGGTERAAVNYAIGYRHHGLDSKVLVLGEGNDRLSQLIEAGVETRFLKFDDRGQEAVMADLKTWKPDIIHLHNFTSGFVPYLDKIKNSHTKVVETNVFSRPNYDETYKAVSLSMQLSCWGYWKYTRWMKGAGYIPQVAVVPYIVYQEKFPAPSKECIRLFLQSQGIPAGAFVAGRLGQAHPSKWDISILKVVEATVSASNDIYYLFVGMPANMIKELERKTDFIKSRVKLIDMIQGDENLSLYYHSLNCFVHISKIGESFGYVLAEALMCSLPVITMLTPFNDNAQLEMVGNNKGGICVTNTDKFIAAVMHLYNSPEDIKRIKQNRVEYSVAGRFSAAAVIPDLISYYGQLLRGEIIMPLNVNAIVKSSFALYRFPKAMGYPFLKLYNQRISFHFLKWVKQITK